MNASRSVRSVAADLRRSVARVIDEPAAPIDATVPQAKTKIEEPLRKTMTAPEKLEKTAG